MAEAPASLREARALYQGRATRKEFVSEDRARKLRFYAGAVTSVRRDKKGIWYLVRWVSGLWVGRHQQPRAACALCCQLT
jgi:hypothetical protein